MGKEYQELVKRIRAGAATSIMTTVLNRCGDGKVNELEQGFEERLTATEQEEVLKAGHAVCIHREGGILVAEPFYQKERLIVFGGGHIAIPVVKIAKMVGFYVIVIDDRKEFANKERFPEADEVILSEYEDCLPKIHPTPNDYYVIVTRGHVSDTACVKELMKYPESIYVGLIGSRKRTSEDLAQLVRDGYDESRLQRICTPVGLPIGGVTPEEIAVSILAEVIRRKRVDSKDCITVDRSDVEWSVIEWLAECDSNVCLITILESNGSAPRKAGARMVVFADGRIKGTIGGGRLEASMIEKGKTMIGSRRYEVLNVRLDGEAAMAQGMTCGGSVKLLIQDYKGK